jgi:hypothetical protein
MVSIENGLLWFDDTPGRTLEQTIAHIVERFRQKYGESPNVCYVHPSTITNGEKMVGSVKVLSSSTVVVNPHHFWMCSLLKAPQKTKSDEQPTPVDESVWRWCQVCFVRTEHQPAAAPAGFLQCTVCGHRVIKTSPDRSKEFAIPADDAQPSVVVTEHDR